MPRFLPMLLGFIRNDGHHVCFSLAKSSPMGSCDFDTLAICFMVQENGMDYMRIFMPTNNMKTGWMKECYKSC
jgi:hypothetical protein